MIKISEIENTIKQLEGEIKEYDITEEFFNEMSQYDGEDKIITSVEMKKFIDEMPEPRWEIKTKIPTLDKIIGGFRGGELVVLSAETGRGKSKLAETFTYNFAEQNIGGCWFSYEMSPADLLERFGDNFPIFFMPKKLQSSSIKWIETRIIEALAKSANTSHPVKYIIIDHLHYLFDLAKTKNTSLELGALVRILKKIAMKWGLVIFLISHTGKVSRGENINIGNIRDTSFTGQEADFVIMLERKLKTTVEKNNMYDDGELYEGATEISVHKNRRTGKTGKFKANVINNKFVEVDEHQK